MSPTVAATSSAAFRTEVAIIGAGVVGLAIARSLAKIGKEVLVMERGSQICSETSSRNSEVIHAGLYYPQNSLKAKFCVQGKQQLYEFCNSHNIPYKNCGKLIVATTQQQYSTDLPLLQEKAIANGVLDTKIVSEDDVKFLEPDIQCVGGALLSPSTGVIDSHSYFLSLLGDAETYGAALSLNTSVDDVQIMMNKTSSSSSSRRHDTSIAFYADDTWIECDHMINCAGLWAHRVAAMTHTNNNNNNNNETNGTSRISWKPPTQYFAKGTYFRLQGKSPNFQHLIYPLPEPGGLGVHATIDYSGQSIKFGPDVEWIDPSLVIEDILLDPDPQRGEKFYDAVRRYWPDLTDNSLVADYVGIRPKLTHPLLSSTSDSNNDEQHDNEGVFDPTDFNIIGPKQHGVNGLIHLFGIESPGLTSSMAIADYVRDLVLVEDQNR